MTLNQSRKRRSKETKRDWNEPIVAQPYPSQYSAPNFQTGRVYEIPEDVETLASTGAIVPYSKVYGDEYGSSTSDYNCHYTTAGQSSYGNERYGSTEVDYFPHSLSPPEPAMSFTFVVDTLEMAPGCWHFLPRPPPVHNNSPALGPRTRRNDFVHINKSAMYRWENGEISHATEYSFTNTPSSTPLKFIEQSPCSTMVVSY